METRKFITAIQRTSHLSIFLQKISKNQIRMDRQKGVPPNKALYITSRIRNKKIIMV